MNTRIIIVLFLFILLPAVSDAEEPSGIPPGFGPSYVGDSIPDRLLPGHSYPVLVTFRNTGLTIWKDEMRRIGLLCEGDFTKITAFPSFVEVSETMNVTPGKTATFGLTLLPVGIPGMYDLSFSVVMRSAVGDQKITETYVKRVEIVPTDGISSPGNGSVFVDSPIPDIRVTFESILQGNTPVIIADVKPGSYDITASNDTFQRTYPVMVERGTMTRLIIQSDEPSPIEMRKVGPMSDGTVFGYIEANIPFICIVLLIIGACAGIGVHGIRKREKQEKERENSPDSEDEPDDVQAERVKQENLLLDKIHRKKPLFEGLKPEKETGRSTGGYSSGGKGQGKPVKIGSMNRKSNTEHDRRGQPQDLKREDKTGSMPDVAIEVRDLEAKPGFAKVTLGVSNHSDGPVQVEDQDIGAGGLGIVPVEIPEPVEDSPDILLPLRILAGGSEFIRNISIPYNRGIALLARGVVEKAYEYFRTLLRSDPGNSEANMKQAEILLKWGFETEVIALLEEMLNQDPSSEDVRRLLEKIRANGEARVKRGEPDTRAKVPGYPDELSDRYTPIRVLGEDPFALVILVRRNDTGELRALKIPRTSEEVRSSLYTEISLLYQLKHPYVLRMFRAEFSPVVMLELEYVAGGYYAGEQRMSLSDLPVPLPEAVWFPLIAKIAEGLGYLHKQGVRHYHLSPRYILLDEPMVPKISGLIRESLRSSGGSGEEEFFVRAPEQIDPGFFGKPGKRTDLYLLGAIWFWLATGEMITPEGVNNETGDEKSCLSSQEKLYSGYDPLFHKLVARYKRDRYSSVDAFLDDLRGLDQA